MISSKELGKLGENYACRYLKSSGYTIVERNYRCRLGEIDIIAQKNAVLCFIEVKTRKNLEYGEPEEAIESRKIHKIKLVSDFYLCKKNIYDMAVTFDAISVIVSNNKIFIKHIKNILS